MNCYHFVTLAFHMCIQQIMNHHQNRDDFNYNNLEKVLQQRVEKEIPSMEQQNKHAQSVSVLLSINTFITNILNQNSRSNLQHIYCNSNSDHQLLASQKLRRPKFLIFWPHFPCVVFYLSKRKGVSIELHQTAKVLLLEYMSIFGMIQCWFYVFWIFKTLVCIVFILTIKFLW